MKKAVFLDRDGTINVEKHYLHEIKEFSLLPNTLEALRIMQDAGFLLIIITNQSGIARGLYSERDFIKLNNWMLNLFRLNGIIISKVYYCPHLPTASITKYAVDCNCRKPKLGLYYQAISEFDIDIDQSYAIGDKLRDCAICETTGCKGFLVYNNESAEIIEKVKNGLFPNVHYSTTLMDCSRIITRCQGTGQ